jgi:hypothetical protein
MSKLAFGPTAAAVVAFSLTALTPDAARSQSVFEVCSSEITSHCSAVLPGEGHLYACLYANEEKLSDACDEATMDVLKQLDLFSNSSGTRSRSAQWISRSIAPASKWAEAKSSLA